LRFCSALIKSWVSPLAFCSALADQASADEQLDAALTGT
jgi:hypothetical protein